MKEDAALAKYPPEYLRKMAQLLGSDYAAFVAALKAPRQIGLRVNTLKITVSDFNRISPFSLLPITGIEEGVYLQDSTDQPGRHPYHAAGLYYMQEPSAMVAGSLLDLRPGELVIDLAAAPGGKASHLAARMGNDGLLVANDMQSSRAQLLAQNLERLGVTNALICDESPTRLAQNFGPVFDRVLLDAPCSGESMFRRLDAVEWSPAMVSSCARRQADLLATAAQLVRPGGILAYVTCAFSPEENEEQIDRFLAEFLDFSVARAPSVAGFDPGRPDWIVNAQLPPSRLSELASTVRLWPFRFPGEGHFIAILKRSELAANEKPPTLLEREGLKRAYPLWDEFRRQALDVNWSENRLHLAGSRLYRLPEVALNTGSLHLLRYGLYLGEVRRGYFKPAHTLAMALRREEVQQSISWAAEDSHVAAYMGGHDFPSSGPNGWVLVTVDGFPLGWGKRSNGRLKNHYPRGLRYPV